MRALQIAKQSVLDLACFLELKDLWQTSDIKINESSFINVAMRTVAVQVVYCSSRSSQRVEARSTVI